MKYGILSIISFLFLSLQPKEKPATDKTPVQTNRQVEQELLELNAERRYSSCQDVEEKEISMILDSIPSPNY